MSQGEFKKLTFEEIGNIAYNVRAMFPDVVDREELGRLFCVAAGGFLGVSKVDGSEAVDDPVSEEPVEADAHKRMWRQLRELVHDTTDPVSGSGHEHRFMWHAGMAIVKNEMHKLEQEEGIQ